MQKWAYTHLYLMDKLTMSPDPLSKRLREKHNGDQSFEEKMQTMGAAGWELVSVTPDYRKSGMSHFLYTFKRPLSDDD